MVDIRSRIEQALDGIADETVKALVEEAITSTKQVRVDYTCPKCKKRNIIYLPGPDPIARAKALEILANQGKGKPQESKKITVSVHHTISQMTNEQLAAIAEGKENIVDAEFKELNPVDAEAD